MFSKREISNIQESINELSEQIQIISEKQNSQYTEIMMQLKEYTRPTYEDTFEEGTDDDLYEQAKEFVITSKKASTSWLQRKLGIGYSRAAKLIDTLESEGVIGSANGSIPREVLIKKII